MSTRLQSIQDWEALAQDAKFRPADMAALCPISLRQLERFFVAHFSKTPKAWTRELRCKIARRLLAEGWTDKAVAAELSFTDASHLCREFRELYGLPPRDFIPTYRGRR